MAFYEERAIRNGVSLPIQCLAMQQSLPARPPRMHYHDYTELLYGTGGRVTVHVGEKRFALGEGDLAIIHINEPHDVTAADGDGSYTVVKFLPRVLLADEQTYREYSYALSLMENAQEKQNFFSAAELASIDLKPFFDRLMREWDAQDFGYELALRADVTHIFLQILRFWRCSNALSESAGEDHSRMILQKAMDYVSAHHAELTEEEVAEACGISRSYFSRLFKRSMRIGFSAYVNHVRMREAERLLLTTDQSITEIAVTTGFSTTSYFIDRFRTAKGVTPARYRALHK